MAGFGYKLPFTMPRSKLPPAAIESALEAHPDVLEAAVFGIPNEEWGETVHAVVVVREGGSLTEEEVVAHSRAHLASYKIPRSVSWMDELPKTGVGKFDKRALRARLAEEG